ncbi:MAG: ATP-grasp domain-containing protein [Candidatus Gracilibacteria bacterium]|nr:ATP-grasp domain-containing protein [Candidatus Gracilibacteria bacterium]
MTKILINISRGYKMHAYYDFAYTDLYKNYSIQTFVFFDKELSKNIVHSDDKNEAYKYFYYESKDDLLNQIKQISKEDIYYINTFDEILVLLLNEVKKELGFVVSDFYEAFRNKNLQRELLLKNFPETTVSYFEIDLLNDDIEDFYNKLNFPYVIKPASGVQSSGVSLIHDKNELINYLNNIKSLNINMVSRGIKNLKYLVEEFIDGEMYTINYFVDDFGNISYSPIVKVNSARDLGIDDFSNYVRINGNIIENEINFENVKLFIQKNINALGIKNTFIHHEFKLTTKLELKNIELNARIGGYRLEMMQDLYGFNLLTMPLGKSLYQSGDFSNAVFVFYPNTKGIFKGFNSELLEQFEKLNSYSSIRLSNNYIGKEIGLTKDGFSSIAALRIINKNLEQFKKDYDFIEGNYKNLIILQ